MPYRIEKIPLHRTEQATEKMNALEAEGWQLVPPMLQFNQEALTVWQRRETIREAMDRRLESKTVVGPDDLTHAAPAKKKRKKKKAVSAQ